MPLKTVMTLCSGCEEEITGEIRKGIDGEELCDDCFDDAELAVCPNCDTTVDCGDLVENPDGERWCEGCVDDDCFTCDDCGNAEWNDDRTEVRARGGRYTRQSADSLCASCVRRNTTSCSDCDTTIYCDDATTTASGDEICDYCYSNCYFTCPGCEEIYNLDDGNSTDYATYCSDCVPCGGNFEPRGFRNRSGKTAEIGSDRCYGLELETDECDGYSNLSRSRAWGAKDDCTVDGKEIYSDILSGDEGLDAIRELTAFAGKNNWRASHSAGYHLHLDMRSESEDSLFAIAYAYRATQEVWKSFIATHRLNHQYTHDCRWVCADIDTAMREERSFYSFACRAGSYNWCNLGAFNRHTTIEIRAYEGTCNEEEVCNWVKAHTRFADWASKLGYKAVKQALDGLDNDEKFAVIVQEVWKDSDLSIYYGEKAKNRNHRFLTKSIGVAV